MLVKSFFDTTIFRSSRPYLSSAGDTDLLLSTSIKSKNLSIVKFFCLMARNKR